jgi:hypothetical protein
MRSRLTPKAFANFSLGHAPGGRSTKFPKTLKALAKIDTHRSCERFQRYQTLLTLALGRCPRLKLANAFGVLIQSFLKFEL